MSLKIWLAVHEETYGTSLEKLIMLNLAEHADDGGLTVFNAARLINELGIAHGTLELAYKSLVINEKLVMLDPVGAIHRIILCPQPDADEARLRPALSTNEMRAIATEICDLADVQLNWLALKGNQLRLNLSCELGERTAEIAASPYREALTAQIHDAVIDWTRPLKPENI